MFKKVLIFSIFLFLISFSLGALVAKWQSPSFEDLSPEEMYQEIVEERDLAIQKAVERNDFRCCIQPPCTMCYMEPNQWNNYQAGTCACDDLIAQGEEPCPQCVRGLCGESEEADTCSLSN